MFYGSSEPSHQRQKGVRWNWSKSYLSVAEIENLFLTEPFVTAMAERFLITDPKAAFSRIRDYVIEQRFKAQLDKQINAATISALKAALAGVDITPASDDPLDKGFEDAINSISPASVLAEQIQRFESAANNGDYEGILPSPSSLQLQYPISRTVRPSPHRRD